MARHRFRSQPALQRSGGPASTTLLGFCLVVSGAAVVGALVSLAIRGLDGWADTPAPAAGASPPAPRAQTLRTEPAPVAPQLAGETLDAPAAEAALQTAKVNTPRKPARTARAAKLPTRPAPIVVDPQEALAQQHEYKAARDAYDANERAAGYRWARQYKVRTPRYCRALEQQRNAAFMEGCLSYAGSKTRASEGASVGDPG